MANRATVSYSWEFSAAHRLMNHTGKCRRLHGHNYGVTIEVEGAIDQETGMVIDFSVLKEVSKQVDENLDHMTLLQNTDPIGEALASIELDDNIVYFLRPPTVEVICAVVRDEVRESLAKAVFPATYPRLTKVTISETETGVASIVL